MGNRQTSWQNKHRRRDSFVIEGRRPPWAKLPMWDGRAFKLCDEKFAGRNWEIFSQREAGTHGVGGRLGLQLYFDSSEIGRKDLCSEPPPALIPETPSPPPPWRTYAWIPGHWRWHRNRYDWVPGHYQRPLWGPTLGFTATGFRVDAFRRAADNDDVVSKPV